MDLRRALAPRRTAHAHCDIPCGIYDPHGAELAAKTKVQKGVKIEHAVVPDANHFFQDKIEDLTDVVGAYVDRRTVELEKERRE